MLAGSQLPGKKSNYSDTDTSTLLPTRRGSAKTVGGDREREKEMTDEPLAGPATLAERTELKKPSVHFSPKRQHMGKSQGNEQRNRKRS